MADKNPNIPGDEHDPRVKGAEELPDEEHGSDYVTMESLAALEAHAPGLIEHQSLGDKHITMYKDVRLQELWLLAKNDDHIVPKTAVLGGFGAGQMSDPRADDTTFVPWTLPNGDKTYVQLMAAGEQEDGNAPSKAKVGTFYTLIKPLEKAAAQKRHIAVPNILRQNRG